MTIIIPRELLLVEIERRCRVAGCNAKTTLGLTKVEARAYCGFRCERCDEWNRDALIESDVPEWWEELAVMDLFAVREVEGIASGEPGEVILRMSDGYKQSKLGK